MVAPALITAAHTLPGTPEHWKELEPTSAALLVEFGADESADLDPLEQRAIDALSGQELLRPADFTRDRHASLLGVLPNAIFDRVMAGRKRKPRKPAA